MNKVIRLGNNKQEYNLKKYNNAYKIHSDLAIAKGLSVLNKYPMRRKLRIELVKKCNKNQKGIFKVSQKDFKRIEQAYKSELPVVLIDIMEVLYDELIKFKNKTKYRAPNDNVKILKFAIDQTHQILDVYKAWLAAHGENEDSEKNKYRKEMEYLEKRIDEFNKKHPGGYNDIFR